MSRIAVVSVTHNSKAVIGACLRSCAGLEVLVVDNASRDGTVTEVAKYPGVRLIANRENRGFAGAVNQAAASLSNEFILLLNPDVRLSDFPAALVGALENDPRCGIAAGVLINEDGSQQKGFTVRRFPGVLALTFEALGINRLAPWNSVNRHYRYLDRNFTAPVEVDQPAGAFLLFRRELWRALGGFDERFFPVWFEDVDFCRRAVSAGWRITLVPSVRAIHSGGHSVNQLTYELRELSWYGSLLKYAAKHFPAWKVRMVSAAVVLGSVLRAVTGAAFSRSLKPFATHSKVARLATGFMLSGSRRPDAARERRLEPEMKTVYAQKQE